MEGAPITRPAAAEVARNPRRFKMDKAASYNSGIESKVVRRFLLIGDLLQCKQSPCRL